METLGEQPSRKQLTYLVRYALYPSTVSSKHSVEIDGDMIKNLLQCVPDDGKPPNWTLVFADLLVWIATQWETFSPANRLNHLSILRIFQVSGYVQYPPPPASSPNPLVWADFLLACPGTWTNGSIQSVELSAGMIEYFLNTISGNSSNKHVDTNAIYRGATLRVHFVNNLPEPAPRQFKVRLLRTVQLFLDRGADRARPNQKGSAREKLERMYTASELSRVGFYKDVIEIKPLKEDEEVSRRQTMDPKPQTHSDAKTNYFFSWFWRN